ncbi:MAG TPA: hypothetical protein PKZ75_01005 [Bacteroidia bacterium]|nr:hypothetical protein [Bacteroidia bacterium]
MLKSSYIIFICLTIGLETSVYAQHQISKYEYRWAFFHPIAAKKVQKHLIEAMDVYTEVKKSKQLDEFESGGTLDAFRHAFTMAYLSRYVKSKKLRKLGKAHERGNEYFFYKKHQEFGERADSLACVMDLRNNELGFEIGSKYCQVSKEELKTIVIEQIKKGNAWKLKKNSQNQYVSCKNEPILMENYKKQWFLPKCLIKSNE